ncbi:ABC transporter ATP-binding protein [Brevibacillus formosus]|uniref:ABC transporter ATP-binding protein n=1 Tax=Brevibacillus formosus TaxID=54913 RepID=A0A837KUT6_9BACL|nr:MULTISPECIES: ABC transporter ATP-binding protein [Brevibacillus]KLH99959.1 branched-chain amino acid ABC transporter ATP-binding protein [Brevibacillus formosus]MED1944247.1 ABC transporter ATP-binding protein [Brevibacillus formosus]MED1959466.1 ABC transporter ATP-binding protein [Brevibacillus formosus]MED1999381.1 ABC transporter ATP-binding protein [Brevibacillus formosus]MED2082482.1 ABC transporter ATP-binding protein [Brevibacillus formosus]
MMLQLDQIETYLDQFHILQGVSLSVQAGSITVLFGRNGAGKTTTLRSIMGLAPIRHGQIRYRGEEIGHLPTYSIARKGIGYVPENQGIFHDFTVEETFRLAMQKNDDEQKEKLAWMLDLFPDLRHYWKKKSGHLSGGQKQMLAIARAYVNSNGLLLIDEPSKGLAPIMVEKLMFHIESMKQKTTVLLVEQNFMMASMIGEQYYLMDEGKIVRGGAMQELKDDADTRQKYLGIA